MMPLLPQDIGHARSSTVEFTLVWCIKFGLAFLFAYAGLMKMIDPVSFGEAIANYRIVSPKLVPWIAATLPGLEIILALCLFKSSWMHAASLAMSALMCAFSVFGAQAWLRDLNIDCGCFGTATPLDGWTLVRDMSLLTCGIVLSWKTRKISPPMQPQPLTKTS